MAKTNPLIDGMLAGAAANNLINKNDPDRGSKAATVGLMTYFRQAHEARFEEESQRRAHATEHAQRLHNQEVEANLNGIRSELAQLQNSARQEEYRRSLTASVRQRIARAEKAARRLRENPEDNEALLVLYIQSKNICLEADEADLGLDEARAVEQIGELLESQDVGLLTRIHEFDKAATDFAICLTAMEGIVTPPWESESNWSTDDLVALRSGLSSIGDDIRTKVERAVAQGVIVLESTDFRFTAQAVRLLTENMSEHVIAKDGSSDYKIPNEKNIQEIKRNIDNTLQLRTIRFSAERIIANDSSLENVFQFVGAIESLDDVIGVPLRDRYGPQLTWLTTSATLMKEGACDLENLLADRDNADKESRWAIDKELRQKSLDIVSACKSHLKASSPSLIKSLDRKDIAQSTAKKNKMLDNFVTEVDGLVSKVVKSYCENAIAQLKEFKLQAGKLNVLKGRAFVIMAHVTLVTSGLLGFFGMMFLSFSRPGAFEEEPLGFITATGTFFLLIWSPVVREYSLRKFLKKLRAYFVSFSQSR